MTRDAKLHPTIGEKGLEWEWKGMEITALSRSAMPSVSLIPGCTFLPAPADFLTTTFMKKENGSVTKQGKGE